MVVGAADVDVNIDAVVALLDDSDGGIVALEGGLLLAIELELRGDDGGGSVVELLRVPIVIDGPPEAVDVHAAAEMSRPAEIAAAAIERKRN